MLVYGAILLAIVVTVRQLWTTDFGMDDRVSGSRRIVTEVDPDGAADRAGIAVGDEILKDPGLITWVAPWTEREVYEWNYRLHRALESGHVPMRIRRGDIDRNVDIVPLPAPSFPAALRQLRGMGTHLPTAFAFLGVAALLVRRPSRLSKDERARRIIVASCAFFGPCWLIEWPSPGWPLWLYPVSSLLDVCSGAAGVALLANFAWSYPTRSRLVDRPLVHWGVLGTFVPCALLSVLNSMHVIGAPIVLHGNGSIILWDSLLALAIVIGLGWQRRKASDSVARRQATWLLACSGVGMFVPILFLEIPQHVFGWSPPILSAVLFPFPLLIPIGFAAVVARYGLFSLDGIARRAGPYAIAVVTSLMVCVAVTLGVQALFAWRTGTTSEAGRWLGIVVAVVLTEPLRRGSQVLIDRAFSRDRDAFLRQCSTLAAKLAGTSRVQRVEEEVRAMLNANPVQILTLGETLDSTSARQVEASLRQSGAIRVVDVPDPVAVDALRVLGFELLVEVPSEDGEPCERTSRALALTLHRAAHRLTRPEHDALALVGRVIGAALARDGARRALANELARSEDERRHIAMELHDGIGATLTAARSMARRLRHPSSATGSAGEGTLDALDATLREGLGDLRASLWSLDPGEASWEGLVARVRRHVGDHCAAASVDFTMTTEGDLSPRITPAGRLGVLRVVQEAVNNAIKHGSPRHIEIRMIVNDERCDLVVEDDGTGLSPDVTEGRGLGNMARRIGSLAGSFQLETKEQGGARVVVSIPSSSLVCTSSPRLTDAQTP
ncbi:MAG: hypothetical protein JWP87_185 [Labilithrix sp.]|nr:hypothetical protein [Labilithrix sp.]